MQLAANEREFFKYDGMIKKFYYSNQRLFNHPSLCLDLDDVLQEMRILIINALPKYDSSKGASLSTYLYMHLSDRLKDMRSKILRRMKYNTGYIDDSFSSSNYESNDPSSNIDYLMMKLTDNNSSQDSLADFLDVKIIMENMRDEDRELFVDRYIKGNSFAELQKIHNRSNTLINKKLRRIDKIFETLRYQ